MRKRGDIFQSNVPYSFGILNSEVENYKLQLIGNGASMVIFFETKEETTKGKQGEGSAVTLKAERPPIIGETVAAWDGTSVGEAKVVEEEKPIEVPRREEGEITRDFNQRLLAHFRSQGFDFLSVGGMQKSPPSSKDLGKLEPVRKGLRAVSAPRSSGSVPR